MSGRVTRAALRTTRLYAGLGAGYVLANAISHPHTLGYQLTHFAPQPTEGAAGLAAAFLALAAHVGLREAPAPDRTGSRAG